MCLRFQSKERGGRHGDILPTIPFKNGELTSLAAIELLPPGLQSRQVLWLMAAAKEPWAQGEHHLQAAASDDKIGILKIHATASVDRATLKVPWNVAWDSTETQSQFGISLHKSCPPQPGSSHWGVLTTGTPSETLEC